MAEVTCVIKTFKVGAKEENRYLSGLELNGISISAFGSTPINAFFALMEKAAKEKDSWAFRCPGAEGKKI
jgi:hypothetical protein